LLTDRLSTALKTASITVTQQEERTEDELINQRQNSELAPPLFAPDSVQAAIMQSLASEALRRWSAGQRSVFDVQAGNQGFLGHAPTVVVGPSNEESNDS
jgi:hypothetical protein